MNPLLEVSDLRVQYGGRPVLKAVSVRVDRGEIVAVLGRNGAGKTTLLRSIAGLIVTESGSIRLGGSPLDGVSPRKRIQLGISYVAQTRECFPDLTVRENVDVVLSCLSLDRAQRNARWHQILSTLPQLGHLSGEAARRLSGGQQQMLVVGMALAQRPKVLLLDEPSLGLGQGVLTALESCLRDYAASGGAVLLVEQSLPVAAALAARMAYLENGNIEIEGVASQIVSSPVLMERFLGVPAGEKL
jgi:branched-chain amino acid transport system ATP-binding protein